MKKSLLNETLVVESYPKKETIFYPSNDVKEDS